MGEALSKFSGQGSWEPTSPPQGTLCLISPSPHHEHWEGLGLVQGWGHLTQAGRPGPQGDTAQVRAQPWGPRPGSRSSCFLA